VDYRASVPLEVLSVIDVLPLRERRVVTGVIVAMMVETRYFPFRQVECEFMRFISRHK
jgi:hypothetical protein